MTSDDDSTRAQSWAQFTGWRPAGRPKDPASLRQQAAAAGIRYSTLLERLKLGWPLEAALSEPVRQLQQRGIAAKARAAGLNRTTVSQRLRRGLTMDEALRPVLSGQKPDREPTG